MGSITDATILHHVCIVLVLLWFLNSFGYSHPVAYFMSFIYLYLVHDGYVLRLTKKLQFEEKRESNQKRVLLDSESVRWLNHAVEKMWPICMEQIVSQKILLPMVPWFLQKYKPWTVKDIEVQNLYLGRSPPIITDMRVLPNSNGDDHLVLELGMNFRTAEDMSAVLAVKLKKRLGFGMLAKLHLLGMHIEGKVLVGVKFIPKWPFIGRLRVCFAGPPYFQMTVKPIFTHGLDVTELPGIAGWIDNLLSLVFEQTLVEPNMLVVDVEKFVSPQPENWFSVDAKDPIAQVTVEVIEGADLKPSDLNGLADPYVKGQLGPYKFRTKIQKKTLAPKWREEFKIPICSWESQNVLAIEVRDKDRVFDDIMGDCTVNFNELRGGQRHDIWLPLQNIKMGRLHLAVTVSEDNEKNVEPSPDADIPVSPFKKTSFNENSTKSSSFSSKSLEKSESFADKFEPIDIEGQSKTGIWIHHPGSEVGQKWEPRKGKIRHVDSRKVAGQVQSEDCELNRTSSKNSNSSTDESIDAKKPHSRNSFRKGLRKIGSMFQRSPRGAESSVPYEIPEPSEHYNIKAVNAEETGVTLIVDDTDIISHPLSKEQEKEFVEETTPQSPKQRHMKDKAKSIMKHAGKSAHGLKNAIARKPSRKDNNNKTEAGLGPSDENEVLDSNSSDGSLPSVTESAESGLVIPGSDIKTLSGNSSFKSESCPSEIPKDSSSQATEDTSLQSPRYHEGTGAAQTTEVHPQ